MNTFDFINEAIAPGLASVNDRCKAFDLTMKGLAPVDWKTGKVDIADEGRIRRAYVELYHSADLTEKATPRFIEMASLGIAVLHSGDENHASAGIPWYSFFDLPSLASMTSAGWSAIGIQPWMSIQMARSVLRGRFPNVPADLLEPDHLEALVNFSRRELWRNWTYRPMNMPKDSPPVPPDSVPGGGGPASTWGDPERSYDRYKALGNCLANAEYTFTATGVTMCLDRPCADLLQAVLSDQFASSSIMDLIFGNIFFWMQSGFASVAGWVGAAIQTFRLYWAAMIALHKNSNGVCLTHFYPWEVAPGWARGR